MELISKLEAKEKGLKRFFTGEPCIHGHISERLVSKHTCIDCKNEKARLKYTKTKGASKKKYYLDNREDKITKQLARQNDNHDEYLKYQQSWRSNNRESAEQYRKDNAGYFAAKAAKRRKKVVKATPQWFEEKEIQKIYIESARITKETGIIHHVDHIVPLIHELVCGLHCKDNLQIITADENLSKSNNYTP